MTTVDPPLNLIPCSVRQVQWSLASLPCDRCQQPAARAWEATRTAIDLDLDQPVVLAVVVSVHHCPPCRHYFRAQPPFLRPDAIYTNRVVTKAVQAVYQDGLAMRRVPARLARDFWVQPSEKMVRQWCRAYAHGLDFEDDYQAWVVASFSGVLCVDEVYEGRLALLVAVDPAAPDGDRLVGYQLVHGAVDHAAVTAFLTRLRAAGISPAEVITDGSSLYPAVLAQIWPTAAHQLCLFHETRRLTKAVDQVLSQVRASLPTPPSTARPTELRGRPRKQPPAAEATDAAAQGWRERQAVRQATITQVHRLHQQGVSQRAIAKQLGISRETVARWLEQEVPAAGSEAAAARAVRGSASSTAPTTQPAPPAPWASWDDVQQVRGDLTAVRFLLLRRPDHLTPEDQHLIDRVLRSPVGEPLGVARTFLEEWYAIWRDEQGQRRTPAAAQQRYQQWQATPAFWTLAPLARVLGRVDAAQFGKLSQFLHDPIWEATNNGAERGGRAFRHLQGPHYKLRTRAAIDDALRVRACLQQEAATAPVTQLANRCPRGRKPRPASELRAAA